MAEPSADDVAAAIAILGDDAALEHVAAVADVPVADASMAIAALVRAGTVHDDALITFADNRIAAAALERVPADRLARLHTRAAASLHREGAPFGVIADHLAAGAIVRKPWAIEVLRRAARERRDAGDPLGAIRLFKRCLSERPPAGERVEVLLELAAAERTIAVHDAVEHFREVIPLIDDIEQRVPMRVRLARTLAGAARVHEALDELDVAAAEATDREQRLNVELAFIAISRQTLDTRPLGRHRLDQLSDTFGANTIEGLTLQGELAYEQVLAGVSAETVIANAVASLGGDSLAAVHALPGGTRQVVLLTLCWCGELWTAERAAQAMITRARRDGAVAAIASANVILYNVAWRRGQPEQVLATASAVLDAASTGFNAMLPVSSAAKAAALAALGDDRAALAALELPGGREAWASAASFHGYLVFRSRTMMMLGRPDDAYRSAVECGTLANVMGTINPAVLPWRSLAATAAVEIGLTDAARTLADDELHLARQFGRPAPIAASLRAAALTRAPGDALALLMEARDLATHTPDAFLKAQLDADIARGADRVSQTPARRHATRPEPSDPSPVSSAGRRAIDEVQVRALGGFAVVDAGGREITPAGLAGKVIRVLVAAGGCAHLEELGDRLWDEGLDPQQTRVRLRNVLSRTRTDAGPLVLRKGDLVQLAPNVRVDADMFERAAVVALREPDDPSTLDRVVAALLMYRGDLLPTDPFAEWAALRREALRLRYLASADMAFQLACEAGAIDLALDVIEGAFRHDPYDEDRYLRAADALHRSGRRSDARVLRQRAAEVRRILQD